MKKIFFLPLGIITAIVGSYLLGAARSSATDQGSATATTGTSVGVPTTTKRTTVSNSAPVTSQMMPMRRTRTS